MHGGFTCQDPGPIVPNNRPSNILHIVLALLTGFACPVSAQSPAYTVSIRLGELNTDCYPSCSHATEWLQQLYTEVRDSSGMLVPPSAGMLYDWGAEYCNGIPFQYGFATGVGLHHIAVDGNLVKNDPGCCAECAHQTYVVGVRVTIDDETFVAPRIRVPTIPVVHALRPNYPNPFNDRTHIPFDLKEQARVRLEIFDLRGRLVDRLADRSFAPGGHAIDWTPHNCASGVYLCQITITPARAPAIVLARKMVYEK